VAAQVLHIDDASVQCGEAQLYRLTYRLWLSEQQSAER
jgi:hypothetical protein